MMKPEIVKPALQWMMEATGEEIDKESITPLTGGTSATLYEMKTAGSGKELVLRLFHDKEWLQKEPDLAKHEAASLEFAGQTSLAVPEIVAFDESGEIGGMPAVLMTKNPGKVILEPGDENEWVDELAQTLAALHNHSAEDFPFEYFSYNDALVLERPLWSKVQDDWMRAFYIVAGVRPPSEECFIHRDYHPGNVLWEEGKISGVVDWVNACRGPAGVDVGHCRVNLVQLYGIETADKFLAAYEKFADENFQYNPYWDLLSLTDILEGSPTVYAGWRVQGMKGLSDELIRYRLDEYLLNLLDRFDA